MGRAWLKLLGLVVAAATLLSGCATSYLLDNSVQSFSSLAGLPAPATYRFERLPLQQAPGQEQLEAMADAALHQAGLRRDDASPRYTVQIGARLQPVLSPWADPWERWGGWGGWGGWGYGHHHRGWGVGFGGTWGMEPPWYHREVSVIVREIATGKVVFETHASNDGPWLDNTEVFPAMFQAAMHGFPNPPPGPRRVDIQVGPAPKSTS